MQLLSITGITQSLQYLLLDWQYIPMLPDLPLLPRKLLFFTLKFSVEIRALYTKMYQQKIIRFKNICWIFQKISEYFFQFNPYCLRVYIHIPFRFMSSFEMLKSKLEFWTNTKNTRHKTGTHFEIHFFVYYIYIIARYTIQTLNCVLGYSILKYLKKCWEICMPVLWCPEMREGV